MKVRFYNLGKIKETELDVRPLTVIIGPNNTNKTYIAYSLYGLWQEFRAFSNYSNLRYELSSSHSFSVSVADLLEKVREEASPRIKSFEQELEVFFQDSSHKIFSRTHFEIDISRDDIFQALQNMLSIPQSSYVFSLTEDTLTFSVSTESPSYTLYYSGGVWHFERPEMLIRALPEVIRRQLFSRPYLLPAERNAFIITYKVLANRRMKLLLEGQRHLLGRHQVTSQQLEILKKSGELRYPQPIEDFLDMLFEIEIDSGSSLGGNGERNGEREGRTKQDKRFAGLASAIEMSIQNANRTSFRPTALGGREVVVKVGPGLDIDLYNASSSIKQLAPLLLYLRYRAAENDLLIIDEPEMDLHPESQARLLEILAMLVNNGVNVLLTTHSPYIMAHLNNLAQEEEASASVKKKEASRLYLKNPQALLRMEQIGAYEMRDNQLHNLYDPDFGIRWDTLSDVSAELQQKYFQIYEEGHAKKTVRKSRQVSSNSESEAG